MITLQLVAVVLSLAVLAAHFLRARNRKLIPLAAVVAALALLAVRRPWAARVVQLILALGVLEWCRTLFRLASGRIRSGRSFVRLVIILGGVTMLAVLSVLAFQADGLRRVYGLD